MSFVMDASSQWEQFVFFLAEKCLLIEGRGQSVVPWFVAETLSISRRCHFGTNGQRTLTRMTVSDQPLSRTTMDPNDGHHFMNISFCGRDKRMKLLIKKYEESCSFIFDKKNSVTIERSLKNAHTFHRKLIYAQNYNSKYQKCPNFLIKCSFCPELFFQAQKCPELLIEAQKCPNYEFSAQKCPCHDFVFRLTSTIQENQKRMVSKQSI